MTTSTTDAAVLPAAPDPPRRRRTWRDRLHAWDSKGAPYAFITPFFLIFLSFGLFPLVYTAYISFQRVELNSIDKSEWVGWKNYVFLLGDDQFWLALRNTISIGLLSTVPQLLMALGIAALLNYKLRARNFYRVGVLLPYATSVAAATLVFGQLFGRDFGMINLMLESIGIDHVDWESGTFSSHLAISIIVTWRWTGYNALIYLAGMQNIPEELYEAAAIDGAGKWRQFISVTLPGLRPVIIFTVVISSIGALQLFGEPLLFGHGTTGGGASHQFQTLGLYLYEQGWGYGHLGRAAAVAWTMLLIIVVVVLFNSWLARRGVSGSLARIKHRTRGVRR